MLSLKQHFFDKRRRSLIEVREQSWIFLQVGVEGKHARSTPGEVETANVILGVTVSCDGAVFR